MDHGQTSPYPQDSTLWKVLGEALGAGAPNRRKVSMANLREQIFEYADRLYAKALESLGAEEFRKADIYAISCYGAAVYLASDENGPEDLRKRAAQLEEAAWSLSKQAYAGARRALIEPRMMGHSHEDEEIRGEIHEIARIASER